MCTKSEDNPDENSVFCAGSNKSLRVVLHNKQKCCNFLIRFSIVVKITVFNEFSCIQFYVRDASLDEGPSSEKRNDMVDYNCQPPYTASASGRLTGENNILNTHFKGS